MKRICILLLFIFLMQSTPASGGDLRLQDLIDEAVKNNHEILMAEAKWKTSTFRIPQAGSLPDPVFMIGYQNEGWKRYTFGEMEGAQWIFSASQMIPYPGKLSLKARMAERESEALSRDYESVRLRVIKRVKELYHDLFLAHKELELIKDRAELFSRIEEAALSRYSTGMATQQEVLMAQTERYMLLEKEDMLRQRIESLEAALNTTIGREADSPLGRPQEPQIKSYPFEMKELLQIAYENSPELRSREGMVSTASARVSMAEREYYPDFTLTGSVMKRAREFEDMWSLTVAVNLPIFYKTKQRQAINEARSLLSEAEHELEAVRIMLSSEIRDNYSMLRTAERLMDLYKNGLIPRTRQDFEAALTGYLTGKIEALTVINRLKALIDLETLYWRQVVEREKAIARLEAVTGLKPQE